MAHVTAIVFGGKKVTFTHKDIQEMIEDIDLYYYSDNLAKWLWASRNCRATKTAVVAKLKELHAGPAVTIDVRY